MSKKRNVKVPYVPNEKQAKFHACGAGEVVFGGSRGGGKSAALVMEAFMYGLEHAGRQFIYSGRHTRT